MKTTLSADQQSAIKSALEAFNNDPARLAAAVVEMTERAEFGGAEALEVTEPNGDDLLADGAGQSDDPSLAPLRTAKSAPATAGPAVITLDHVNRKYRMGKKNLVQAVQDVSLQINEGEFVAITGSSGSGKSTLLNLIGGLDRPDAGQVTVAGQLITKLGDGPLSRYRSRTIGYVFQFFYLQPFLTVRRNLEVPAMFSRLAPAERRERIDELAGAVGLTDRLEHLPRELSGGQMQRAAIARALVNRPKVLLADEPTGNLDSANSHSIMELFHQVRETYGTTVVVVTHDQNIARTADRIITMHDGRVQ